MQTRRLKVAAIIMLLLTSTAFADHRRKAHHRHGHHHHGWLGFALNTIPRLARSHYHYRYSYRAPLSYSYGYGCYPYSSRSYYSSYSIPYGTYYRPRTNYVEHYLPPVYYPAELAYGPKAIERFMGATRTFDVASVLKPFTRIDVTKPASDKPRVRESNLETLRLARKFIGFGDELFKKQKYHEALQQYKTAARVAPDLAEAYFRQGHALVATSRYELAATAFKRGLEINPEFTTGGFRLGEIYGEARLSKASHLDTLATAAIGRTDDSDLLFLLGVFLHFDGEPDRAKKFFRRAADMSTTDSEHVFVFLPEAAPDDKATRKVKALGVDA